MSTAPLRTRHRNQRPHHPRIRRDPDAGGARVRRPAAARLRRRAARSCSRARHAPEGIRRRQAAGLPARDAGDPRGRLDHRAAAAGHPGPPRRDHRSGRPQDDHQRAQLGRQRLHGGLRGREHAALGQQDPGPDQPARCDPPHASTSLSPNGKAYKLERQDRDAVRASARLAPAEKHVQRRRRAVSGGIFDFALYFFHNAKELARARQRPVLLPAEAREPSRGAAVERHLRDGAGRARRAARARSRRRC